MIDEKKLIEDIDNNVVGLTNIQIMQIADIIEKQPKVGDWIPCSSGKLPQRQDSENFNLELYLVRLKYGRIRLGYRDKDGRWRNEYGNRMNVVEWKPLDEPYKEEVN